MGKGAETPITCAVNIHLYQHLTNTAAAAAAAMATHKLIPPLVSTESKHTIFISSVFK